MMEKVSCYLWGPQEIRLEFREKNVESNRTALRVVALILCVIELYNICRVLFLSRSGLGRIGGDEFVVLLGGRNHPAGIPAPVRPASGKALPDRLAGAACGGGLQRGGLCGVCAGCDL